MLRFLRKSSSNSYADSFSFMSLSYINFIRSCFSVTKGFINFFIFKNFKLKDLLSTQTTGPYKNSLRKKICSGYTFYGLFHVSRRDRIVLYSNQLLSYIVGETITHVANNRYTRYQLVVTAWSLLLRFVTALRTMFPQHRTFFKDLPL